MGGDSSFVRLNSPCVATHDREPEGQLESREGTVALLNKCLSWGGGA